MARSKVSQWLTRAKDGDAFAALYLRKEYNPLLRHVLRLQLRKAHLFSKMPTERRFAEFTSQIWLAIRLENIDSENQLACILTRLVSRYVEQLVVENAHCDQNLTGNVPGVKNHDGFGNRETVG
jgi:hypothetical protein